MGRLFIVILTILVFQSSSTGKEISCLPQKNSFYRIDALHGGKPNSEYVIRKTLNLKGRSLHVPYNCTIRFVGGGIINGNVVFDNTTIEGEKPVFQNVNISGTLNNSIVNIGWFNVRNEIAEILNVIIGSESVKEVYIPEGIYLWNEPVRLKSDLMIHGGGENTVLKVDRSYIQKYPNKFVMLSTVRQEYPVQGVPTFQYDDLTGYKGRFENIVIQDLTFDLNYYGGDNTGGQMAAIKIEDASNTVIDNCHFVDGTTESENHTYHAVYFVKSKNCEVRNCKTENISFVHIIGCERITCKNNYGKNSIRTWLESNDGREITYIDNILEGNTSMTSAVSFNSRSSIAERNVIRTSSPIICGIVLGHPDECGVCNVADSCVVRDNTFEILGNGEHDYGVLVQNAKGVVIDHNVISSSGNTIRINKISQALVKNNTLTLTNISSSNVYINSLEDNILLNNNITDTGEGVPSDYNLVIYVSGGNTQIKNNKISTQAKDSKYNLIWAAPGGNVNSLDIEKNELESVSVMGHVCNLMVSENTFKDLSSHLFSNSVNVEGTTRRVVVKNNTVIWKDGRSGYLVYLIGQADSSFKPETDLMVEDNYVNTMRKDLVRYQLNSGKIKGVREQTIRH